MAARLRLGWALASWTILAAAAMPATAQGGAGGAGRLDVTLSTAAIAFPSPGVFDFDAGWIDHSGMLITVRALPRMTPWELRIRADAGTMGGYGKPVEDILWRTATSTVWTPLTTTDRPVVQGQGEAGVLIYFRMRLDWALDSPGTYGSGITFTVVEQ